MQFNHVPMETWSSINNLEAGYADAIQSCSHGHLGVGGGGSKQGLCGVISSSTGLPQDKEEEEEEEDLARNEDRKEMINKKKK